VIKIHIYTTSLQASQPAIIVVPTNQPVLAQTTHVTLACPSCGAKTATVEQHGTNAHVIVPRRASVLVNGEPV
jgi:predicted RNA-binding Zn-ribbon protein involved in translation (DUF1610 family)